MNVINGSSIGDISTWSAILWSQTVKNGWYNRQTLHSSPNACRSEYTLEYKMEQVPHNEGHSKFWGSSGRGFTKVITRQKGRKKGEQEPKVLPLCD